MENKLTWMKVQEQIGYEFENLDLLKQAFTRRSYTEENGAENNEVFEFIGDKALVSVKPPRTLPKQLEYAKIQQSPTQFIEVN